MNKQNGFTLVEGLLIVLILSVIGFAGYYVWSQNQDDETEQTETVQEEQVDNTQNQNTNEVTLIENSTVNNSFKIETAKAGDKIGAMKVVSIGEYNGNVLFEGEVTISGSYKVITDDDLLGSIWCMEDLDDASLKLIPQEVDDERSVWFCFNNEDKASVLLGNESLEKVTVSIDDYYINLKQSSVYNTATLVEVK